MASEETAQQSKPDMEHVVSVMKVRQQQQLEQPEAPEAAVEEMEQPEGSVKPKRYLPPQATPNMNAENAPRKTSLSTIR